MGRRARNLGWLATPRKRIQRAWTAGNPEVSVRRLLPGALANADREVAERTLYGPTYCPRLFGNALRPLLLLSLESGLLNLISRTSNLEPRTWNLEPGTLCRSCEGEI